MAYTVIPTVTTGDVATASWANTYLKNNFAAGVPDIFTTDGDMAVGTGANAAERVAVMNASNLLKHEVGGLEFSAAAVTTNDAVGGASSGVMEIKTPVTEAEAEAGSNTRFSLWSSERVKQAIIALGGPPAATEAEVVAGSVTNKSITPGRAQFHPTATQAWVNFAIDTSIDDDENVTDITDNGVGSWRVNFTNNFAAVTYAVTTGLEDDSQHKFLQIEPGGRAVDTLQVRIRDASGNLVDIGATDSIVVACYGPLA